MNEEVLELNELQSKMVQQLDDSIKTLQHQLNSAVAMALAAGNISDVNVLRMEPGKVYYNRRVQPAPNGERPAEAEQPNPQ